MSVEIRRVTGIDERGEPVVAYVIPDGYTACLVSGADAESLREWRRCSAVRIGPRSDDGRVGAFEIEGAA